MSERPGEALTAILNFHGIGEPARPVERGEARYWISTDMFSRMIERARDLASVRPIAITFDDGNASDLRVALPVLERNGFRASFFVIADRLDQSGSLSRQDLRMLRAAGMTIGSHGYSHVDWRRLDSDGQRREWREARQIIADAIDAAVDTAAIPFGSYDRKVLAGLKEAGYSQVMTSDRGLTRLGWLVERTSLTAEDTPETMEMVIRGVVPLATRLRRGAGMLLRRYT